MVHPDPGRSGGPRGAPWFVDPDPGLSVSTGSIFDLVLDPVRGRFGPQLEPPNDPNRSPKGLPKRAPTRKGENAGTTLLRFFLLIFAPSMGPNTTPRACQNRIENGPEKETLKSSQNDAEMSQLGPQGRFGDPP